MNKYAYLDTNMLISLADNSHVLDLLRESYSEYTPATLTGVLEELEKLRAQKGKIKRDAKLALAIIKQQDLKTVSHSQSYVDNALLEVATPQDAIVTIDKELIRRAREQHIAVLTLAQGRLRVVA